QAGELVEVRPRHTLRVIEPFLAGLGGDPDALGSVDGLQEPLAQALESRRLPQSRSHLVGLHAPAVIDALVSAAVRE
ncbi:hypothetical protein, partial [Pseudomonas syringae group genomosp. 7]|uniref:hypothetical protein n=1 Tax=Pseudomonas syringae group genomosp. 7 TaxID=251699 RepID=UPI00376F945D